MFPLEEYEKIIVLFSGGKDSLACVLDLLERGVPRERIELWHHDIDGGHPDRKMDWPVTQAYVRAVSEYLGLVLRTSWRVNGFWGEVYRMGASWPIQYTEPDSGIVRECKLSEKQIRSAQLREAVLSSVEQAELEQMGRRMKFPAKSGNLATRWCSSILKIMVADSVIRNIAMDELKEIGDCRKFPAKGSISSGCVHHLTHQKKMGYTTPSSYCYRGIVRAVAVIFAFQGMDNPFRSRVRKIGRAHV